MKSEPVQQLRRTISSAHNKAASILQRIRTMPPPVHLPAIEEESEGSGKKDPRKDDDDE